MAIARFQIDPTATERPTETTLLVRFRCQAADGTTGLWRQETFKLPLTGWREALRVALSREARQYDESVRRATAAFPVPALPGAAVDVEVPDSYDAPDFDAEG